MEVSFYFRKLLDSGKSENWPDLLKDVIGINDVDSGPLLLYFQKLESYLELLGHLEPIKPSRHIARSTSTPVPTSTARILTNLIDANLPVDSTVASVEQSSDSSEQQSKYKTGTIVLLSCGAVAAVVAVVGFVMVRHRRFCKSDIYSQAATQEI
jgi:hypothetical protein